MEDLDDEIPSPCRAICQLDETDRFCIGCYRTPEEIERWASLNPSQRQAVIKACEARRRDNENKPHESCA